MLSSFIVFIITLTFCIAVFILSNYTKEINEMPDRTSEKESTTIRFKARANWRVYENCWKLLILPVVRLKYKRFTEEDNMPNVYSRFDITLGWLFAFIRLEFEKCKE